MNKKQRNRKSIIQNKRNKMTNRRYSSTVKTLFKFFYAKKTIFQTIESNDVDKKQLIKQEMTQIANQLFSMIDKATKKNVIHKNTAARKKSTISKVSSLIVI